MNDFQDLLKSVLMEVDDIPPAETSVSPKTPEYEGDIKSATNPRHSYIAFEREHAVLISNLQKVIDTEIDALTSVISKQRGWQKTVNNPKYDKDIPTAVGDTIIGDLIDRKKSVAANLTTTTADRHAARDFWKNRKSKPPTTPPATGGTV